MIRKKKLNSNKPGEEKMVIIITKTKTGNGHDITREVIGDDLEDVERSMVWQEIVHLIEDKL